MHLSSKRWVWRRKEKQGCVGRYLNLRKVHTWTLGYLSQAEGSECEGKCRGHTLAHGILCLRAGNGLECWFPTSVQGVMDYVMCPLGWAEGMPRELVRCDFWGVCEGVSGRDWPLNQQVALPIVCVCGELSQSFEVRTEQKGRKGEFALLLSWHVHLLLSSDIRAPGSQAFGCEFQHRLPWASSSQTAGHGGFSASVTAWAHPS